MGTADPRIEDLVRLRHLYDLRGPLDGQDGKCPDGRWSMPVIWATCYVLQDAQEELIKDDREQEDKEKKHWVRWFGPPPSLL